MSKKFDDSYMFDFIDWSAREVDAKWIEYKKIKSELMATLSKEIEKRTFEIFLKMPGDFNLRDIKDQLYFLANSHWDSRNEIEINRDRVLEINNYKKFYCDVKSYKTLEEIDQKKKDLKIKIEDLIRLTFTNWFLFELNENKLQKKFKIQVVDYGYCEIRSIKNYFLAEFIKQYFNSRNFEVVMTDKFVNFTIENYKWPIRQALKKAIVEFQADSKRKFTDEILIFFRNLVERISKEGFVPSLQHELEKYVSKLIRNRTAEEILSDDSKLIDEDTFLSWGVDSIDQIETEYPRIFAE